MNKRPKIALWFRYGPADHSELFHAMPQIVEALAAHCDAIVHCGALVNFAYDYRAHRASNVLATQELLRRTDLEGALVTIDAMHTQTETGRIIVQECGADYLLTVKGNQTGVAQNVQKLYRSFRHGFSPSTPGGGHPDLRAQPEPV